MSNQLQTVSFHNQQLTVLIKDNQPYIAMKPICENIGLDWAAQLKRIKRHHALNRGMVIMTTPSKSGNQEYVCLPLSMLNGWLFGIDTNRVKPELRAKLEQYQLECFDVLFEYWTTGEVKKKQKTTVDQRTPLRDAVNLLVSKKALTYSEAYSVIHQRFNVSTIEDLPLERLSQAIEYVHKVALEGEYISYEKERAVTLNLEEIYHIAWLCNASLYMIKRIQAVTPALNILESKYHGIFYDMGREYKYTINEAKSIILDKLEQFDFPIIFEGKRFPNLSKH